MAKNSNPAPTFRKWHERHPVKLEINQVSKTHQSHRESVDINNIIKTYDRTGRMPNEIREGQYMDVRHLQGDNTTLIQESRTTLSTALTELNARKEAQEKMEQERIRQLELDAEELKKLKSQEPKSE